MLQNPLSLYFNTPSTLEGSSGKKLTKSLFLETNVTDKDLIVFTLEDKDVGRFTSLYRLYMEADDVTEYAFAMSVFNSWAHWELLCGTTWFIPYITRWRKELELRTAVTIVKSMRKAAEGDTRNAFAAQKFLLTRGWLSESNRRGRPSKAELASAVNDQVEESKRIQADQERILSKSPPVDTPVN